ncbi:MAG: dienelactone hydrolase family protein [Acidobacteria bacterium]|nr:dienelactone hydrolase family protein [Acidobacteriota bacterium]
MKPHFGQPVAAAGRPLGRGRGVVIMVHGRGAGPENILDLVPRLDRPDFTYLAPAAAGRTWYPYSFMADREKNEPGLSSGLHTLAALVDDTVSRGVDRSRIVLLGFSQGACLTCEFAASHAARYAGVIAYTGGLIGPPGTTWNYGGSFSGTPVFLGCSDADSHVPQVRVDESAAVFARMGAAATTRIYPGMGHVVNDDEIAFAQALLDTL